MVVAVAASSEFAAFEPPVGHSHRARLSNILADTARDDGNALYGQQAFVQKRGPHEAPVVSQPRDSRDQFYRLIEGMGRGL